MHNDRGEPCPVDGVGAGPGRPGLSISSSPTGIRVIGTGARLDATAAAELRHEAMALLARSVRPLVIDLSAVRAADPAAASAALRDLAYEAGSANVDLRVVRDPRATEMARAVLDDETLFEVYPTLDQALHHPVRGGPPPGRHPRGPAGNP